MNKEEAALVLMEDLIEHEGCKIITNHAHQKYLLDNAIYFNNIKNEPTIAFHIGRIDDDRNWVNRDQYQIRLDEFCNKIRAYFDPSNSNRIKHTNYIFVDNLETTVTKVERNFRFNLNSSLSFFTIIGGKEVSLLKELYKGDLSEKVEEAAKILGIEKDLEIDYSQLIKKNPSKFCEYFEAVSDEKRKVLIKEVINYVSNKKSIDEAIKNLLNKKKYKDLMLEAARDELGGKNAKR